MSNETVKMVTLPLDLMEKVLQFIGTRPYTEVASLIAEVQNKIEITEVSSGEEVSDAE